MMVKLDTSFSIADASYPNIESTPSKLLVTFTECDSRAIQLTFFQVPAFSWQESIDDLMEGEPWDGVCELLGSPLLLKHTEGQTIYSPKAARHIRLNFNAWGRLDVICEHFDVAEI